MRTVIFFTFCVFLSTLWLAQATGDRISYETNDIQQQHRAMNQNNEGQVQSSHNTDDDRHNSNLYDYNYKYLPNENEPYRTYGNPAPHGFKQTESVFHILFVRNQK